MMETMKIEKTGMNTGMGGQKDTAALAGRLRAEVESMGLAELLEAAQRLEAPHYRGDIGLSLAVLVRQRIREYGEAGITLLRDGPDGAFRQGG